VTIAVKIHWQDVRMTMAVPKGAALFIPPREFRALNAAPIASTRDECAVQQLGLWECSAARRER
jgi:hypothetical protein